MHCLPTFYNPANAGIWSYTPDLRLLATQAEAYRKTHHLKPVASDRTKKVTLLLIDVQRDFCFPEGTLYVGGRSGTGAIDDNQRIAEFIYREMSGITSIVSTLDTHWPFQIFTPSFWEDQDGQMLLPHDMIDGSLSIIRAGKTVGKAKPRMAVASIVSGGNYAALLKQAQYSCQKLEQGGKYLLYIWPEHCVLGTTGHSMAGIVHEAVMFHSYVRMAQPGFEVKGGHPLSENYSVLGPEVREYYNGQPLAQKNVRFLDTLLASDAVIIAGQAASHCVKSTIDDLIVEIQARDPSQADKVYIMADGSSAVAVPDGRGGFAVDFTDEAAAALSRYEAAGMHIVRSTDPMSSWLKN